MFARGTRRRIRKRIGVRPDRFCIFALLMFLLFAETSRADPAERARAKFATSREIPRVTVTSRVAIEPVTATELLLGQTLSAVPFSGDVPSIAPARSMVVRELPNLWQVRIPDGRSRKAPHVRYELRGTDGSRNRLSLDGRPGTSLRVQLKPILPQIRTRANGWSEVEGGVAIYVNTEDLRVPGDYSGTLIIDVSSL
jgi:hypothetical protein